jgi:hypothetical protein
MKKLMYVLGLFFLSAVVYATIMNNKPTEQIKTNAERLHDAIVLFADSFDVPLNIAFNVAKLETGYRGPYHENYNHKQFMANLKLNKDKFVAITQDPEEYKKLLKSII